MAVTMIQYRQEYIAEYERTTSSLRQTTVTEGMSRGNQFTFLTSSSGDASATTRGANGLIPARTDSNTQHVATLVEWHRQSCALH